jgi:beta-1,4-mannosyl-glycoprotein beta-1,4-N-acetylglucosaminyltransferase
MKIFDCTTYYNEDLMLEVRFNILNKHVDKFVIAEAKYSHSGEKKKLNFNISKFPEFKKKIIYLPIENEPQNIIYKNKNDTFLENEEDKRTNSIKRINHQRDRLKEGLSEANDDDYVLYSDNDEIPNLENFNFETSSSKILIFKQKLLYYKFNLFFDRISWFGTKGCKKKNLLSLSWLRDIKPKKYPNYRLDTIFSNIKYMNVKIIEDGGWHFSQLKTPKDIHIKNLNSEGHEEYKRQQYSQQAEKNLDYITDLVKRKKIDYDHMAKSQEYKYSKEFSLKTVSMNYMPAFLQENSNKYSEWFDFDK